MQAPNRGWQSRHPAEGIRVVVERLDAWAGTHQAALTVVHGGCGCTTGEQTSHWGRERHGGRVRAPGAACRGAPSSRHAAGLFSGGGWLEQGGEWHARCVCAQGEGGAARPAAVGVGVRTGAQTRAHRRRAVGRREAAQARCLRLRSRGERERWLAREQMTEEATKLLPGQRNTKRAVCGVVPWQGNRPDRTGQAKRGPRAAGIGWREAPASAARNGHRHRPDKGGGRETNHTHSGRALRASGAPGCSSALLGGLAVPGRAATPMPGAAGGFKGTLRGTARVLGPRAAARGALAGECFARAGGVQRRHWGLAAAQFGGRPLCAQRRGWLAHPEKGSGPQHGVLLPESLCVLGGVALRWWGRARPVRTVVVLAGWAPCTAGEQ